MQTPADSDSGVIRQSLPCLGCGYDLRTIDINSVCPECGAPVQESLTQLSVQPQWLLIALNNGLLTMWGGLLAGGLVLLLVYVGMAAGGACTMVLLVPTSVLVLIGHLRVAESVWMLTDQTSVRQHDRFAGRARKILRLASVALATTLVVVGVAFLILSKADDPRAFLKISTTLVVIFWLIRSLAGLRALRCIAQRMPPPIRRSPSSLGRVVELLVWLLGSVLTLTMMWDIFFLAKSAAWIDLVYTFSFLAAFGTNLLYGVLTLVTARRVGRALRTAETRAGPLIDRQKSHLSKSAASA